MDFKNLKLVPPETYRRRMKVCESCEYYRRLTKQCKVCFCIMPIKARFECFDCDKKKWDRLEEYGHN